MYDLIIKQGLIIDGTEKPPYYADVAVHEKRIRLIAPIIEAAARTVIDVSGKVVAPGFIDIHSHSDFTLLSNPRAESKIRQGITTEVVGNCGFTAAPVRDVHRTELMDYLANTVFLNERERSRWRWKAQHLFLREIEQNTAVNLVPLVGHGTIRIAVMGFEKRTPTRNQLRRMCALLEEEIQHGLWGISTGLQYEPGCFASTEELTALAQVVAGYGGIYTTHLKSEGTRLLECLDEAIHIGAHSGAPIQISHLKAAHSANWGKIIQALQLIDEAQSRGVAVDFDVYPYTAYGSSLIDLVPPWAREEGIRQTLKLISDRNCRTKILAQMNNASSEWESPASDAAWDKVRIATLQSAENRRYEGKNLKEIAEMMGCTPAEAALNLLEQEAGSVKMVCFGMCEKDLTTLIKHPRAVFCTDGRAVAPYGKLGRGAVHPRYYGAFPRILGHYARSERILTLPEAVRKMSALPAAKLGLIDRGLVKEDYWADLTIFNPETVIDQATFEQPHQYPCGIDYVIVNGILVISRGEHSGALPGKILRRNSND